MKELAAIGFYSLLMSDVEELCENPPRARRPDNVEPNMLCLAFRLSKLDKDWSMFIPFRYTDTHALVMKLKMLLVFCVNKLVT